MMKVIKAVVIVMIPAPHIVVAAAVVVHLLKKLGDKERRIRENRKIIVVKIKNAEVQMIHRS